MRRFSLLVKTLLATAVALAGMVVFAATASAHVGEISIGCTGVTFSFSQFPSNGGLIDESVTVNGTTTSSTFDLTSSSGSNTIPISGANGDTVSAQATWTVGGGGSVSAGPQTLSGCVVPSAQISIACTGVTFTFSGFPSTGASIAESVTVAGQTYTETYNLTGSSGSNVFPISGANGETVSAAASWTINGRSTTTPVVTTTLSGCTPTPPPCPSGTSIHIRWHYSANGSSGSWSATTAFTCPGHVSMGPQAMEGNLKVAPGATLMAGYDFTIPGDNNSVTVTFTNPEVTFTNVTCASGATPTTSTITVPMPTQSYTSTNGGDWYPSGDQSSSLVYQGSISVPNVCNGSDVDFQNGGTFTATIS
jgi:trimeric autotransporter adhesin